MSKIDECCDEIDAAMFSGDYFHDRKRALEMEELIARWRRGLAAIKAANYYEEEETPKCRCQGFYRHPNCPQHGQHTQRPHDERGWQPK